MPFGSDRWVLNGFTGEQAVASTDAEAHDAKADDPKAEAPGNAVAGSDREGSSQRKALLGDGSLSFCRYCSLMTAC